MEDAAEWTGRCKSYRKTGSTETRARSISGREDECVPSKGSTRVADEDLMVRHLVVPV